MSASTRHCRRLGPAQAPGRRGCWTTRRPLRTSANLCGAELGLEDLPERDFRRLLAQPDSRWPTCPECARIFLESLKGKPESR
jgi:hypothetical protein